MAVLPLLAGWAGWHHASWLLAPLLAPRRYQLLSIGLLTAGFLLTLALLNSYRLAASNVYLLSQQETSTAATTTTTSSSALTTRTAICYANQFNSAQANPYLVLTQTGTEPVVVRGVAVGGAVDGTPLPLLLKPGGDANCAMNTVQTLVANGAFDLTQMVYSAVLPADYSITNGGTDLNGMNIALNSLPNGCCTITRIA